MSDTMIEFLAIKENRDLALSIGMVMMFGSLITYSIWFHHTVRKTPGGRELMTRQGRNPAMIDRTGSLFGAINQMRVAGKIAGDVNSGKYGLDVKRLMSKTYWFFGGWTIVGVIWFGGLIYVDSLGVHSQ